jgi:hypothetical protein
MGDFQLVATITVCGMASAMNVSASSGLTKRRFATQRLSPAVIRELISERFALGRPQSATSWPVYTDVSSRQLDVLLRDYELGSITELRGIADGSENTNYFFSTERGSFILTLFENSIREDLSYPFKLTRFLSERGIPYVRPIESRLAQVIGRLDEKPAVIGDASQKKAL